MKNILNEMQLDGAILTNGYNIEYISKYRGRTGCMLILGDEKYIFTDSRYTEQATIEAKEYICVDIGSLGYSKTIESYIEAYSKKINRKVKIGFENNDISYMQYKAFNGAFEKYCDLVEVGNKFDDLRMVKMPDEIEKIAMAEKIGDQAFDHIISYIEEGMTELEVALELEYTMKKLGATGLSFDTIVASGPNSSLPHAMPSTRKLANGDFVTMDFGCIYDGYCSDMTRTVLMGDEPTNKQMDVYSTVRTAQSEAMKMIKPGIACNEVDKCARDIIKEAGYGDYFGHGLGHGVGLYIHEEPRFSPKCNEILKPGMVITVEPGIYLPGEFGVRIEDLVVVTEDGYRNLTNSPHPIIML